MIKQDLSEVWVANLQLNLDYTKLTAAGMKIR